MRDQKANHLLRLISPNLLEGVIGAPEFLSPREGLGQVLEYLDSYLVEKYEGEGKSEVDSFLDSNKELLCKVREEGWSQRTKDQALKLADMAVYLSQKV